MIIGEYWHTDEDDNLYVHIPAVQKNLTLTNDCECVVELRVYKGPIRAGGWDQDVHLNREATVQLIKGLEEALRRDTCGHILGTAQRPDGPAMMVCDLPSRHDPDDHKFTFGDGKWVRWS